MIRHAVDRAGRFQAARFPRRAPRRLVVAIVAVGLVASSGCQAELETTYGVPSGIGADSVNGTSVLAEMFTRAGHRVSTRRVISTSFEHATVIVWAPDRFEAPAPQTIDWFENWLGAEPNRTLIYIGRDYDAAPLYWQRVQAKAGAEDRGRIAGARSRALSEFRIDRKKLAGDLDGPWFVVDNTTPSRKVTTLQGPWSQGVNAAQTDIELHSRIVAQPESPYEILLESEGELIVGEEIVDASSGTSRKIIVANGSFLLNVPLVNHEHRKLAGKLIASLPEGEHRVVFLQSGPEDVRIRDDEDLGGPPSVIAMLGVWPLSVIIGHLVVLGILYAVGQWPIFGVPRRLPPVTLSEFGKHVTAVGGLMIKTRDAGYARRAIVQLKQVTDGDSGN